MSFAPGSARAAVFGITYRGMYDVATMAVDTEP
jgi:hypothetical protein